MDPQISAALDYLDRDLSEYARRAWRLVRQDERFQDICKDYAEAMKAVEVWSRGDGANRVRTEDFHRIATDLQWELLDYLRSTDPEV